MLKAIGFDLDNTLYDQKQFEYFAFWVTAEEVSKYYCINKDYYFLLLKKLFNKNIHEYTFDKAIQLCIGKIPKDWEGFVKKRLLPVYRSAKGMEVPIVWSENPTGILNVLFSISIFRKSITLSSGGYIAIQ